MRRNTRSPMGVIFYGKTEGMGKSGRVGLCWVGWPWLGEVRSSQDEANR